MQPSVLLRRSTTTAAIAALAMGATAATTVSAASAASGTATATSSPDPRLLGIVLPILDPILEPVLDPILTVIDETTTTEEITGLIGDLTALELGTLLAYADATQLTGLLETLDPATLTDALGALDLTLLTALLGTATGGDLTTLLGGVVPADLAGVLGGLTGGDLTNLVGALDPAQITQLLALGGAAPVTELIGGLTGVLGGLGGGDPTAVLGQLTALLDGGLPADPSDLLALEGLLGTVNALLVSLGVVELPVLGPLLDSLTRSSGNAAVDTLIGTIGTILTPGGTTPGGTAPGGTTPGGTTPGGTTYIFLPGGSQPGGTTPGTKARRLNYRANIGRRTVSKTRRSMRFTVSCPKNATAGCAVKVSAMLAGKKVLKTRWVVLARGKSTGVTFKLSKSATKRLKKKGGKVTFRAATYGSSKSAVKKSLTVKKPKSKKKSTKKQR